MANSLQEAVVIIVYCLTVAWMMIYIVMAIFTKPEGKDVKKN